MPKFQSALRVHSLLLFRCSAYTPFPLTVHLIKEEHYSLSYAMITKPDYDTWRERKKELPTMLDFSY